MVPILLFHSEFILAHCRAASHVPNRQAHSRSPRHPASSEFKKRARKVPVETVGVQPPPFLPRIGEGPGRIGCDHAGPRCTGLHRQLLYLQD